MLLFKEFVSRAPEHGQIRVEHGFGCTGSSLALRILRKDDGSISAKCYRCGEEGYYNSKTTRLYHLKKVFDPQPKKIIQHKLNLPTQLISNPSNFSIEALRWVNQYQIKPSEIKLHKILFHPEINRLVLPIFIKDNELVSFQYRRLIDDGYPKYISYNKYPDRAYGKHINNNSKAVVITEDILSGIKCGRFPEYNSFAMTGSSIGDEDKLRLINQNDIIILYLDNDSRQIRIQQGVLKNFFEQFNKKVVLIKENIDPKAHIDKNLKCILTEGVNGL